MLMRAADGTIREAEISDCGRFRWTLTRRWDNRPYLLAVMANPSMADAERDDPTMTLLSQITAHNGFGGIVVVNLVPYRSSSPKEARAWLAQNNQSVFDAMWKNLDHVKHRVEQAGAVLAAWGSDGWKAGDWYSRVSSLLEEAKLAPGKPIYHLGKCANGHPKHPLARGKHKVSKTAPLIVWSTQ